MPTAICGPWHTHLQVFGTFSVDCSGTNHCTRTIGATVGDTPIPGVVANLQSTDGVPNERSIDAAGIVAVALG